MTFVNKRIAGCNENATFTLWNFVSLKKGAYVSDFFIVAEFYTYF
jgi:hypothetical protein